MLKTTSNTTLAIFSLLFSVAVWAQDAPAPQVQPGPNQPGLEGMGRPRRGPGTAGTITALGADSITIKTMDGKTAEVKLSDKTQFRKERQAATLSDFKVGDEIFVRGQQGTDGAWQAEIVAARPAGGFREGMHDMREGMGKQFIVGEVKAINGTQLTISRPDGVTQTISVDESTSFKKQNESITLADIKPGDHVFGRGALKGDVFVPSTLNVGEPRMMMPGRPGQGPGSMNPQ